MEEDILGEVFDGDPILSGITAEKVEGILAGFPLEARRSYRWLARGIQVALYVSAPTPEQASDRPSNADIRRELAALAEQSSATWRALLCMSPAAESALMDHSHSMAAHQPPGALPLGFIQFRQTILEMERVTHLLCDAARAMGEDRQPPKWRLKESREERIRRAHCLSSIYEDAFDATPFVNNWENAPSLGNWPDFYQRIVGLVFGEKATPDLVDVLREARRRHKSGRVVFAPGTLLE